jgi:hypothetical protein
MDQPWTLISALAGGLGIGSLLTAFIQHVLARKAASEATRFAERKEAFRTLLAVIADLDRLRGDSTTEVEIKYRLAVAHVQLVASKAVLAAVDTWREPAPNTQDRTDRVNALIDAMRRDLGVASDDR